MKSKYSELCANCQARPRIISKSGAEGSWCRECRAVADARRYSSRRRESGKVGGYASHSPQAHNDAMWKHVIQKARPVIRPDIHERFLKILERAEQAPVSVE